MGRFIGIVLASLFVWAEPVRWQGKFDRALEISQKSGKPILVLLIAKDCKRCPELIGRINADSELSTFINTRTVPVLVTRENEDYPIELLYTLEFPTLFLLTPDERFLGKPVRGDWDLSGVRALLKKETLDE